MFHSPIGGISLISNLVIIVLGAVSSLFRRGGPNKKYLVTQENIASIENSRFGAFVSRSIAYLTPVVIFCVVASMSVVALVRLYNDQNKVTIFHVVHTAVAKGASSADTFAGLLRRDTQELPAVTTVPPASTLSGTLAEQTFVEVVSVEPTDPIVARPAEKVFTSGGNATTLSEFFDANNLDARFASRKEFAEYLGITGYSGKAEENLELLRRLSELTFDDLE